MSNTIETPWLLKGYSATNDTVLAEMSASFSNSAAELQEKIDDITGTLALTSISGSNGIKAEITDDKVGLISINEAFKIYSGSYSATTVGYANLELETNGSIQQKLSISPTGIIGDTGRTGVTYSATYVDFAINDSTGNYYSLKDACNISNSAWNVLSANTFLTSADVPVSPTNDGDYILEVNSGIASWTKTEAEEPIPLSGDKYISAKYNSASNEYEVALNYEVATSGLLTSAGIEEGKSYALTTSGWQEFENGLPADVSGKWESVYSAVSSSSATWNEVSNVSGYGYSAWNTVSAGIVDDSAVHYADENRTKIIVSGAKGNTTEVTQSSVTIKNNNSSAYIATNDVVVENNGTHSLVGICNFVSANSAAWTSSGLSAISAVSPLSGDGTANSPLGLDLAEAFNLSGDDYISVKNDEENKNTIIGLTNSPITITAGKNVNIEQSGTNLVISSTGGIASVNTVSPLSGDGTTSKPIGVSGDLLNITAGDNIEITQSGTDLKIAATGLQVSGNYVSYNDSDGYKVMSQRAVTDSSAISEEANTIWYVIEEVE